MTVVMRTANADGVSIVDRRPKARGVVDELRMPPQPQPQAYPARVKDAIGITAQPDEMLAHGKVRDLCCLRLPVVASTVCLGTVASHLQPQRMQDSARSHARTFSPASMAAPSAAAQSGDIDLPPPGTR
jgi:hypothetical protein